MRSAPFGRGVEDNLKSGFEREFGGGFWNLFKYLLEFKCSFGFGFDFEDVIVFDAVYRIAE